MHIQWETGSADRLFMRCVVQNGLMRTAEVSLPGLLGCKKSLVSVCFCPCPSFHSSKPVCPNLSTFWLNEPLQEPRNPALKTFISLRQEVPGQGQPFSTLPFSYHLAQQRTRPRQGPNYKKQVTQPETPVKMNSGSSVTHCHVLPYRAAGSVCPNVWESDPPRQRVSGGERQGSVRQDVSKGKSQLCPLLAVWTATSHFSSLSLS